MTPGTADTVIIVITMLGGLSLSGVIIALTIDKIKSWWVGRRNVSVAELEESYSNWRRGYNGCHASSRTDCYAPFMGHIQERHYYEFVRFMDNGEVTEGSAFERAILTDKMYQAAVSAARAAQDRGDISGRGRVNSDGCNEGLE